MYFVKPFIFYTQISLVMTPRTIVSASPLNSKIEVATKMAVKNVQITVLIENTKKLTKSKLKTKQGLTFFIKAKTNDNEVTIMLDTDQNPRYHITQC